MIFTKEESLIIVSQEEISIERFLENLQKEYAKLKNDNLVLDLLSFSKLTPYNVISFLEIARMHKRTDSRSFWYRIKCLTMMFLKKLILCQPFKKLEMWLKWKK